ncbi:hypothetical protein GPECTOR_17g964 [Gonium pectorale]|uniref:Rhamnosyl O-methyltransferase n=1 Tax=Gonium pectorale TaxID=33097 RepID=A0A150GKS2_GONPE|nr:hypothetical protein GPECTOR_17g964 [Gonium pectorale]|eukprot:KXZ50325.1 hypothetical protein GPECTOR_17g964 [Gonium pectorale]
MFASLLAVFLLVLGAAEHIPYAPDSLCHQISQIVLSSNASSCSKHHEGWAGYPHTFIMPELINTVMARQARKFEKVFMLEVGSFSGGSAIRIVTEARNLALPADKFCMMCVDTWLGDVNMIADIFPDGGGNGFRSWLHWDAYNQAHIMQAYCGNLNGAGVSSSIVPFRAPSIVGMKVLERFVHARALIRPNMLYLDSAHEALETLIELGIAWNLVADDGIIFGDDWGWASVSTDVTRFAYLKGITVHLYKGQWLLHKKPGHVPPADRTLPFDVNFALTTDVRAQVVIVDVSELPKLQEAVGAF